jgi:hypothetical protein
MPVPRSVIHPPTSALFITLQSVAGHLSSVISGSSRWAAALLGRQMHGCERALSRGGTSSLLRRAAPVH